MKDDFAGASQDLRGEATLGAVDCTVHQQLCESADIKGYPTLQLYSGTGESRIWDGARTREALVHAIRQYRDPPAKAQSLYQDNDE